MSDAGDAPIEHAGRNPIRLGCITRVLIGIVVVVAVVVAIGSAFDQGDRAIQPDRGFNAGAVAAYAPASVNYLEARHIFLTRLQGGEFVALYDVSSRQQELGGDCRLRYEDTAGVGTLDQLPGIIGAIVEDCGGTRAVWRADGTYAFGAGYGGLDRFGTSINTRGELIIDTRSRSCTRSRGVIGVEPFDQRRCEGAR